MANRKRFDYGLIKSFILQNKEVIDEASLGMNEDWFWTAYTIYEEGEFTIDLDDESSFDYLKSSNWATPTLEVYFKTGEIELYEASIGDFNDAMIVKRLEWEFLITGNLGCLSDPVQSGRPEVIQKLKDCIDDNFKLLQKSNK